MSEMPKKSVNSRPYLKTCELIYQLTSQRIGEKYRKWEADNPKYNTQSQFFPEDRKLIGRVLNCIRTKNNPYLITPRIQEAIIENLDFTDVNELYWGEDISEYFQHFFTILLLEIQEYKDYTKFWMGIPLSTESEITKFYLENQVPILEIDESYNQESEALIDQFINFTFNKISYFEFESAERLGYYREDELVYRMKRKPNKPKKDEEVDETKVDKKAKEYKNEILTFIELPKKLDVFVEKVFVPFISSICLDKLLESHIKR